MNSGRTAKVIVFLLNLWVGTAFAESITAGTSAGVGALARLEPRSRIVRVAADVGPEGGRVERLLVTEGQRVKSGALLAVLSDEPRRRLQAAEAEKQVLVLKAQIEMEEARRLYSDKEYARKKTLDKTDAVSRNSFEAAERDWRLAQAAVKALKAQVEAAEVRAAWAAEQVQQARITAPMEGTILKIRHYPGEHTGNEGILDIADLSHIDAVTEVYERDMPRVKVGQKAEVRVPGFSEVFPAVVRELGYQVMKNDLNSTDPLADRDNRTIAVRLSLEDQAASKLAHLMYMKVDVRILP